MHIVSRDVEVVIGAGHVSGPLDSEMVLYVQRSNTSKIGVTGCSEIPKSLECQIKEALTSIVQAVSLKAQNRKMSFGKSKLSVIYIYKEGWSGRSWEEKAYS